MKSNVSVTLALSAAAILVGCAATVPADLLGEPARVETAQHTMVIDGATRWVNVDEGDVVKFESNGRSFVWLFDGPVGSFDLNRVAPAGMLDHPVRAYVRMPSES